MASEKDNGTLIDVYDGARRIGSSRNRGPIPGINGPCDNAG